MCGITGVLHFEFNRFVDKARLKRMTDIIKHRGPDGDGFYIDNNIGLGHRRLSIIDLNTGDQPLFSDDKQKVIVFNGEIYNYIELRDELKQLGYQFRTDSDTEVVMKSYEEWGFDCQNKFNGMWAFAIWDKRKHELFLSRDRIGEKPLHYAIWNNSIIFGSEMKSLFEYGVPKTPDLRLLELYLVFTNVPEPYSFYKDIKKLKAGCYIIVNNGEIRESKYWDLPEIDESNMITDKKLVYERFDALFRDAVKIRMRSDVPYGAFLSGGLDSSSVVSAMSSISDFPVNTFTIGFSEKDFDESKLALEVANKFKTNHLVGTVNPENFDEILRNAAFHYDEPFGDSSAIPTGYVSKFAAQKVKMVLTGDGGDEVLSGYNSYAGIKITQKYNLLPYLIRTSFPNVVAFIKKPIKGKYRLVLNRIEDVSRTSLLTFNDRISTKRAYTDYGIIKQLVSNVKDVYNVEDYLSDLMKENPYKDEFYKLMWLNFKFDLPNDYLVKVDRMSMAHSLETRVPFLDYRLIEFMVRVDKNVKMQAWERKSVLRNSIGKTLPKNLLKAPKRGFGIPLREWFKEDTLHEKLYTNLNNVSNVFPNELIKKIIDDNNNGIRDNGNFLWELLMLDKSLV